MQNPEQISSVSGFETILLARSEDKPVYPKEIMGRLQGAYNTQIPLTIFIPWGARANGDMTQYESNALSYIYDFSQGLRSRNIPNIPLIMPADVYATEINTMNCLSTNRYFTQIENAARQMGFDTKRWSDIRAENMDRYTELTYWNSEQMIWRWFPKAQWYRSILPASMERNTSDNRSAASSAFNYLRERLCEARITEEQYRPIKYSLVSKEKDDTLDGELPRLYVLPRPLRFPWLQ